MRIGLNADLKICGEAESEDEAIEKVKEVCPDVVLVHISLRSGHGLDLIKRIKSFNPAIRMLVVSGFQESLYAERALRAGTLGYLNEQESNEKLIEAIQTVLAGKRFLSQEISRRLIEHALSGQDVEKTPIESLTDRELEIFRMIGEGIKTSAIAERLFLNAYTIDTHRENIKRKLAISSAAELSRAAVHWVLEHG